MSMQPETELRPGRAHAVVLVTRWLFVRQEIPVGQWSYVKIRMRVISHTNSHSVLVFVIAGYEALEYPEWIVFARIEFHPQVGVSR